MLTIVDLVFLTLMLLYIRSGWCKGILRSLISPVSLLVCSVFGIIHLDLTGNIITSLYITLFGGFVLSTAFKLVLMIGKTTVEKEYRNYVFIGSRLLGSLLSLLWKGGITLALLFLLSLLPANISSVNSLKKNIHQSIVYSLADQYVFNKIPAVKSTADTFSALSDPEYMQQLAASPKFQELLSDEKVQSLSSDEEIIAQIKNEDIAGLITNPKIMAIIKDDHLMKRAAALSKEILAGENK